MKEVRVNRKIVDPYTLKDMYEGYVEYVLKDSRSPYALRSADFVTLVNEFNKNVQQNVLDGKEFVLPAGLGRIKVVKQKPLCAIVTKQTHVNWVETRKAGKYIYHTNEHSDGYIYKIRWENHRHMGAGSMRAHKYYIVPCRSFKRTLAKILKGRKNDYFMIK